jgi:uncharacterized protein (TIGR00266 family)
MQYRLDCAPDFAVLTVAMDKGQQIVAEQGALVGMTRRVSVKSRARRGILRSLKRRLFLKEDFFQNTFEALADGQSLKLSPPVMGEVASYMVDDGNLLLLASSFLACTPGCKVDVRFEGVKGLFSGGGLFFMRVHGSGLVFFHGFGFLEEYELNGGQLYVDDGHVVAFQRTLTYRVRDLGGAKNMLLSGEGIACLFSGCGKVWVQSRRPRSFAQVLDGFRPIREVRDKTAAAKGAEGRTLRRRGGG